MSEATPPTNGTIAYRVGRLESELEHLEEKVDRRLDNIEQQVRKLMWSIIAGSITLAVSALVVAVSIANGGP